MKKRFVGKIVVHPVEKSGIRYREIEHCLGSLGYFELQLSKDGEEWRKVSTATIL